jgi:hypothetical protein
MKKIILILSSLFVMSSCDNSFFNMKHTNQKQINHSMDFYEEKNRQLTRPCVETEGDYETPSKCIHIENKCPPPEDNILSPSCDKFLMMIVDKKTGKILKVTGKIGEQNDKNLYVIDGYQARDKNKIYEIDLSYKGEEPTEDDPIYYREWDKNKTKKLFEEKVTVQP